MSTTDTIKPLLNSVFGQADWKRLSKTRINSDWELREFKEPKSGIIIVAYTHIESQHTQLYNGSKIIFGIAQSDNDLIIRIAEPFYQRAGESNEGLEKILPLIGKALPAYLREIEDGESMCDAGLHSRDKLVADMIAGGFTFDLELANDLNEEYGGPVYGHGPLGAAMADLEDEDEPEDEYGDDFKDWTKDNIIFGVCDNSDGLAVSFASEAQWARDGHISDYHLEDLLVNKLGFKFPPYISGEDMENCFVVWEPGQGVMQRPPTIVKADVIRDLTAAGFKFSQELDDFLN